MRCVSIKDCFIKDEILFIVFSYNCFFFNVEYLIFECGYWQKLCVCVESLIKGVKCENVVIMYLYLSYVF